MDARNSKTSILQLFADSFTRRRTELYNYICKNRLFYWNLTILLDYLTSLNSSSEQWSFRSWLLLVKIFEHIWGEECLCKPLFPEGRKSRFMLINFQRMVIFQISTFQRSIFALFRAYQRSFRLFHGNISKDILLRSRLLRFTQNDHTGQAEFKICPFLKWTQQ